MRFRTNSFFARVLWILLPFTVAVAGLYSVLVVGASNLTEDYIVEGYLHGELDRFSEAYVTTAGKAPLPTTSYLHSYWENDRALPARYRNLAEGVHEFGDDFHVLVGKVPTAGPRLFIELNEDNLGTVDSYETAMVSVMYAVGGLVVIAGWILSIFIARKIAGPVMELAEDVRRPRHDGERYRGHERHDEFGILSRALSALVARLNAAMDREKSFTRHASHELRTPVAVIRNSLALLRLKSTSEEKRERGLARIEAACAEMETLLELFLCLGREDASLSRSSISLREVVDKVLKRHEQLLDARAVIIEDDEEARISAVPSLAEALVNNLVQNALVHGIGEVRIALTNASLVISNFVGAGGQRHEGYGYGLDIVRRVCKYSGWSLRTETFPSGYVASVSF